MARVPEEERSFFPYWLLWEEFAPESVDDELDQDELGKYRTIFSVVERKGGPDALIVKLDQLNCLIAPLQLDEGTAAKLAERLLGLAGRHLAPRHRTFLKSDFGAIRNRLLAMAKAAELFDREAGGLPPPVHAMLQLVAEATPKVEHSLGKPKLDALTNDLRQFAGVARQIYAETARSRGRPSDSLRRRTLRAAGGAIERATSHQIGTAWTERSEKTYRFQAVEGQVLRAFMKLVDPAYHERAMVEDWRRLQSDLSASTNK